MNSVRFIMVLALFCVSSLAVSGENQDAVSKCHYSGTSSTQLSYSNLRALLGNGLKAVVVKSSSTKLGYNELAALANAGSVTLCVDDNSFTASQINYMIREGLEVVVLL